MAVSMTRVIPDHRNESIVDKRLILDNKIEDLPSLGHKSVTKSVRITQIIEELFLRYKTERTLPCSDHLAI